MALQSILRSPGPTQLPGTGQGQAAPTYPSALDPESIFSNIQAWLSDPRFTSDSKFRDIFFKAAGGDDAGGRYPANIDAIRLSPAIMHLLAGQLGYANQIQPFLQDATSQTLAMLRNPDLNAAQQQSAINANQGSITNSVLQRLKSQGAGAGALAGAAQSGANMAATAGNQFRAGLSSGSGRLSQLMQMLGIGQAMTPNYEGLNTLAGITTSTPRNKTGLDAIGGIAGNLLAGGGIGGK